MFRSLIRSVATGVSLIVLLIVFSADVKATVRRVPADYLTIQQAINASVNGDTVSVAPGTYVENIDFVGKGITVTSEAGPQTTIIDGNQANSVVTFHSGEGPASVISGFTLRKLRERWFQHKL
jgi:serine protease